MRRVAAERSVVASNRSMEISELRGSLSRVEKAVHNQSPGKGGADDGRGGNGDGGVALQTPGPTPYPDNSLSNTAQRIRLHRTGSVTFNSNASAFQQRSSRVGALGRSSGPIRAMALGGTASSSSAAASTSAAVSSALRAPGVSSVHVSRRGSVDIRTAATPSATTSARAGPSPAAARVRERLASVRAQFASMR